MKRHATWPSVFVALALLAATSSLAAETPSIYLTRPSDRPAREIVLAHLAATAADAGLSPADLADVAITDEYRDAHNGVTHVYLRQRVHGLEIENAVRNANVDAQGRLFGLGGAFVANAAAVAGSNAPLLSAEAAIAAAAADLGLRAAASAELVELEGGLEQRSLYRVPGVSQDDIPARLKYYLDKQGALPLVWDLVIRPVEGSDWWNLWVDAATGEIVGKVNWSAHATYEVFAFPKESPNDGPRTVETDPHDLLASPYGWHDTNGAVGAEFTDTRGNNVQAQTDLDANNAFGGSDIRPSGGASLDFQPAIDLATQEPAAYREAAVVSLFYWNNIMHDVLYQYGFTEAAGNFQQNNYGRGGSGNDSVQADAQDGSGTNNANFATPPDGSAGRMQMFVWTSPGEVVVNAPAGIAGTYLAGSAGFGPALTLAGFAGDLVLANDGDAIPGDACPNAVNTVCTAGALPGLTGKIAVIDRGNCEFGTKVKCAQVNGAIAAIIANNQGGTAVIPMGAGVNGATVTIPSLMVSQNDGALIKGQLPAPGVNATLRRVTVNRDSDLDAGIMAHEYGHGLSNRLTGGPANVGCLGNDEQAGEGWSDWMTLFLHALPSDGPTTARPVGTYVNYQTRASGTGIRTYPYTTDMAVNLHTYDSIKTAAIPHGVGSVWAEMLWEMYWNLVLAHGWSPDFYRGKGGNNLAFQLVMDGMKLQPCSPGFVDGRNAILQADTVLTGGANQCRIWRAFAKRGLGSSASQGLSSSATDGVQAFDLPAACQGHFFEDGFEFHGTSHWSGTATE